MTFSMVCKLGVIRKTTGSSPGSPSSKYPFSTKKYPGTLRSLPSPLELGGWDIFLGCHAVMAVSGGGYGVWVSIIGVFCSTGI